MGLWMLDTSIVPSLLCGVNCPLAMMTGGFMELSGKPILHVELSNTEMEDFVEHFDRDAGELLREGSVSVNGAIVWDAKPSGARNGVIPGTDYTANILHMIDGKTTHGWLCGWNYKEGSLAGGFFIVAQRFRKNCIKLIAQELLNESVRPVYRSIIVKWLRLRWGNDCLLEENSNKIPNAISREIAAIEKHTEELRAFNQRKAIESRIRAAEIPEDDGGQPPPTEPLPSQRRRLQDAVDEANAQFKHKSNNWWRHVLSFQNEWNYAYPGEHITSEELGRLVGAEERTVRNWRSTLKLSNPRNTRTDLHRE